MCYHCTDVLEFQEEVSSSRRKLVPTRGLHGDVASLPESAAMKNAQLDLM